VGFVILWALGAVVLETLLALVKRSWNPQGPDLAALVFLYTLVFAFFAWLALRHRRPLAAIGLKPSRPSALHWFIGLIIGAGGIALAFAMIALGGGLSVVEGRADLGGTSSMGPYNWVVAALMFTLYAGEEEILSRGLVYPVLRSSIGFVGAVAVSSLAFCLMHILNPEFTPLGAIDIFLAGVTLSLMRELTGDLFLAWGVHFGWNSAQIAAGVPVSGHLVQLQGYTWHLVATGPEWVTGGAFGPEGGIGGIMGNLALIFLASALIIRKHRGATRL
jgi:hypothetical protein